MSFAHPSKHKTMLVQRRRRWADVVQMFYKCFVLAEMPLIIVILFLIPLISTREVKSTLTFQMKIRESAFILTFSHFH